ncbi:hypothetical protein BV25DRAFT_1808463, partial [Artomyces pyxidatus]
ALDEADRHRESVYLEEELHECRRRVAGYAQELELFLQGEVAYASAEADGFMIFEGNGVNRREFRARYGW